MIFVDFPEIKKVRQQQQNKLKIALEYKFITKKFLKNLRNFTESLNFTGHIKFEMWIDNFRDLSGIYNLNLFRTPLPL